MKKILILIVTIIYFLTITLTCFAVNIDGKIEGVEWKNSELTEVFSPGDKTGCNIYFAWFHSIYDTENNILYLSFSDTEKSYIDNEENPKIIISVNGEEHIVLGNENNYPTNLYDINSASNISDDTYMVEAEIILKKNNYRSISLLISFIDSNGIPSASRSFKIYDCADHTEEITTKPEKTTKHKTTKQKTTKLKTTKVKTTVKSKYKKLENYSTKKIVSSEKSVKSTTEEQTEIINKVTTKAVEKNEIKSNKGKTIKIVAISMIVLVAAGYVVTVSRNKKS